VIHFLLVQVKDKRWKAIKSKIIIVLQKTTSIFRIMGSIKEMGFVERYILSHETYKWYIFCVFSEELTELLLRLYKEKLFIKIDTNARRQNGRHCQYQFSNISLQLCYSTSTNTPAYMIRQDRSTHRIYRLIAGLTFSLFSNVLNAKLLTQRIAFDSKRKKVT